MQQSVLFGSAILKKIYIYTNWKQRKKKDCFFKSQARECVLKL
jgi:hypothetical protein